MSSPFWLFGVRHSRTGACWFLGQARSWCLNGDLRESSLQSIFPGPSATSVLVLTVSYSQPPSPQETLQDPPVSLAQSSMESLLCPGPQCTWNPVCALQEWSLCFPQSCGAPALKPTGLQSQMLWGFLFPMPDPQAGDPVLGLRTLTPVGEPLQYNYFLFVSPPLGSYGFDYTTNVPLVPSHCDFFFVFVCKISFSVGSILFRQ